MAAWGVDAQGSTTAGVIPVTCNSENDVLMATLPDVMGPELGLVGPESVYCDWMR